MQVFMPKENMNITRKQRTLLLTKTTLFYYPLLFVCVYLIYILFA